MSTFEERLAGPRSRTPEDAEIAAEPTWTDVLVRLRSSRFVRVALGHLAATLTVVSLVFWSGWYLLAGPTHPYGDLDGGVFTDQFSHMNTARLFVAVGPAIWQQPLRDLVIPLT